MENAHADRTRTSALIDLHDIMKNLANTNSLDYQYDIHRFIEDFDIVDVAFENGEGVTPHDPDNATI